jgi:hypothetical protein
VSVMVHTLVLMLGCVSGTSGQLAEGCVPSVVFCVEDYGSANMRVC